MCAIPQCGDGQDYCCEKSCKESKFGGIRPCNGQQEEEPTGEPVTPQDVDEPTEKPVVETPAPTPEPTAPPTPIPPTPAPKRCCAYARGVENVLPFAGIKVDGMTDEQKRNECITYNYHRSSDSVAHFQGMGTWENEGAAAAIHTLWLNGYSISWLQGTSEDAQRNSLISMTAKCSGVSVSDLQKKKTLDIAILMNKGACCP